MPSKDITSGFFCDVPYLGPVESSIFFDVLTSARVHRIPESMIVRPDSLLYYVDKVSRLYQTASDFRSSDLVGHDNKSGFGDLVSIIPPLLHASPPQRLTNRLSDTGCFISLVTGDLPSLNSKSLAEKFAGHCDCVVISFDLKGFDTMWQSLIEFLTDDSEDSRAVFVLPNIGVYLRDDDPFGWFMFSIWSVGVSSILHYFSTVNHNHIQERLSKVSILLTFIKHIEDEIVADKIQLFFENKLKVCVSRMEDISLLTGFSGTADGSIVVISNSQEEWLSKAVDVITGIHEELCDANKMEDNMICGKRCCVLFIVPESISLVRELEKRLCDCYTSTPMVIVTDIERLSEIETLRNVDVPVILLCFRGAIERQLLRPKHERVVEQMNISALIFTGYDFSVRDLAVYQSLFSKGPTHLMLIPRNAHGNRDTSHKPTELNYDIIQEGVNIILWLFRRFRFPLDEGGMQPILKIPDAFFISSTASLFFDRVINEMKTSGLISFVYSSDGSCGSRLELLGRALSYRFRLPYKSEFPELTSSDIKCILWCYALRKSKSVAQKLISASHRFPSWVENAVDDFCSIHRIKFGNANTTGEEALINHLSSSPDSEKGVSRVRRFLAHCYGKRDRVSRHLVESSSTSCRGWFEQAVFDTGLPIVPQPHVNMYCYPCHTELCEIIFGNDILQCPLDLSYPLVAVHIVLHTTLRNIAVLLEYNEIDELPPLVPIPISVLQSPTFKSIVYEANNESTGLWLDSCMSSNPPISDSLQFSSLMSKSSSFNGFCSYRSLCKRPRQWDRDTEKPRRDTEGFKIPPEAEATRIREFANAAKKLGRENAEGRFKGMSGFAFLQPSHPSHEYYLHLLQQET
ncbi:hypothetical protein TRVL_02591 [Trypanosoma vivax]|nr:hypothetical protein TRVL_02591 [Trypanosoma vivax]